MQVFDESQKEKLIAILTNELRVLRTKAEISQQELSKRMGVTRQTYGAIESKHQRMTWSNFLALLLLFMSNEDTLKIIDWIGVYPPELERYLSLKDYTAEAVGGDARRTRTEQVAPGRNIRKYLRVKAEKRQGVGK